MKKLVKSLFPLQADELGIVLSLGFVLLSNSLAVQVSYIASVSGFLSQVGVNQFLIVSIITYLIMLLTLNTQSLIVDRFGRASLMRGMTCALVFIFALLRLMFAFGLPSWLTYSFFYILAELQWLFFPLIFWVFANDVLNMAQAKRLFPIVASWGFIGKLIGIGIATLSPVILKFFGLRTEELLILNIIVYAIAYCVLTINFSDIRSHDKGHQKSLKKPKTTRESLVEGWSFVRNIPSFYYLSLSILALAICDAVIEFHFLSVSETTFPDPSQHQIFYGSYRLGLALLAFLIQGFLTSQIIRRLGITNTFLITPISIFSGLAWALFMPGIISSLGAILLLRLSWDTIDESARKSFQGLIPEERRGRVSLFIDGYLVSIGNIIGFAMASVVIFISLKGIPLNTVSTYLALSLLVSISSVWSILKFRSTYELSLLNWRLKRRQRAKSILEKIGL